MLLPFLEPFDFTSLDELIRDKLPEEPGRIALQKAVGDWSAKWHLSAPWIRTCAYRTLEAWRSGNESTEFYLFGITSTPAFSLTEREMFPDQLAPFFKAARFMGFEPTQKPEPVFRKEANDLFKLFLDKYTDDRSRKAIGYPKYPNKRKLELHFEWTVLYQVCEMSPDAIAHKYEKADAKEVREQIRSTLKLIELETRQPKRGG